MNRTAVLLALNATACSAIQASAPASKTSTKEDENTFIKPDARSTAYATVTDERLQHPEAGDWLTYRRTYDGSGFSPLSQITAKNIGNLSLAWSLNTDLAGWGLDAQGVQNGIDKVRGIKTVVPKAGTVLVFKLRKA